MDSSVPAAINGLLADIRTAVASVTAPDGSPPRVVDGPMITEQPEDIVQVIGVPIAAQSAMELGNLSRNEEYEIECMARCYTGGEEAEMTTARSNAYALLSAIENQITADFAPGSPPTGGLGTSGVRFAEINRHALTQGVGGAGGRYAEVTFRVRCSKKLMRGAGN